MEKTSVWKSLRGSYWLILLLAQVANAQGWEKQATLNLKSAWVATSHDLQGYVYVALNDDQVLKFDREGTLLYDFSQANLGPFTSIDATNSLNPFLFLRDNQQVVFLDRFLANPVIYDLNQWTNGFVALATPSVDRQLWLLENFPLRITKVDRFSGNVLHEVWIQIGFDLENLVYFNAQQMSLLLVDEVTGLYLFDLFGNLLYHHEVAGVTSAQVSGNSLTFVASDQLHQVDLTTGESGSIDLPEFPPGDEAGCLDLKRVGNQFLCLGAIELTWFQLKE